MSRTKNISILKSVLFVVTLVLCFVGKAQTYPVQTNLSTTGPYYNYLSYYADENRHLQAVVTLTDFNSPPVQARLRLRIEGPGYELKTNVSTPIGNAFTLEPGIPNFINGIDLAPYFQSQNLIVSPSGVDLNNLPEGFTTICVEVIRDGTGGEIISTNNCTSFFLQRFQPSQAIFPMCESSVDPEEMFYTFQWTSPVGYVPSIGTELNYTFSLYEWNDPNNYTIFETGQGLVYTTQTTTPIVQLSDFDLTLQEGKEYVWRVESQITSFGMPVNMIENNGLSAPCTFIYGESQTLEESLADGLTIDLNANGEGERKGKAFWTVIDNTPGEGLSTYSSYLVTYRKKPIGNEGYELTWFNDTVTNFNHFIYQLEASTTYEVEVSGIVSDFISEPSNRVDFTTMDPREYACGEQDLPYLLPNYNPLPTAEAGMHFQIGQFDMQVSEISPTGSTGHYSGKGLIPVAFLGGAQAKVRFDDILVDDQFVVREGQVDVITDGLDNWLHEQYQQFIDPIYVSGTIDSAYVQDGVAWVVVDGVSLGPYTFDPPDYPIVINDDSGNQYTIWPNGTVTVNSYLVVSDDYLEVDSDQAANFVQNNNESFGFDAKEHMQWHENYEVILLSDSTHYFVPNKSVGEGETDVVDIQLPSGTSSVTYKLDGTTSISASGNTITIPSNISKGEHAIYAYNNGNRIGKLNLFVYEQKEKELVIVPIGNLTYSQSDLKTILDQTLGEANIDVTVNVAAQWNNDTYTNSKAIELPTDVGLMNKYSDDMRALRDAYFEANSNATQNANYLFVIPGFDDTSVDGYMVRGKSLGFVASNATLLTYAHELGHGLGALNHTWKDNGPEQGVTDNLMDYEGENPQPLDELTKAQWKELRDLDFVPSFWDSAEDAELRSPKYLDSFNLVGNFCMQDMICSVSKYTQFYNSNSNSLRWQDSIKFKFFTDSTFQNLNSSYLWKYNGAGQKSWTITNSTNSSFIYSFDPNDTLVCDRRITSYCNTTTPIIIPPLPPKVFDYLVYIAYPMDKARPGVNDYSAGAIAYRALMGDKKIQVGHTGICFVKSDTISERAKIDYYDFGRFNSSQSNLGNGIRRHYDLGYLQIAVDVTDSTYKLIDRDSIEIKINNIPYFAGHLDKYGRKEIAFAPLPRSNFNSAYSLATSSFYSVRDFGFGTNKSFCTDFVHDVFNAGGIPMADISSIVSNLANRFAMTAFLISKDKDPLLMKYWDNGDPFLRDINKSPLPINYSIYLQNKYLKFN